MAVPAAVAVVMRIVPAEYPAEPVVQMVPPVPAVGVLAAQAKAQLQGSLAKPPANSMPVAAVAAVITTADTVRTPEPVAQVAAAMAQR